MSNVISFDAQISQFEKPKIGSDEYFRAIEYGNIIESEAQLDLAFMDNAPQGERTTFVLKMMDAVKRNRERRDAIGISAASPRRLVSGKPCYGTKEYWVCVNAGYISPEGAEEDYRQYEVKRSRALKGMWSKAPRPKRRDLPAPRESKQYAGAMSTESARDARLTPQAKALLQVLRALSGHRGWCETTKNRCQFHDLMRPV